MLSASVHTFLFLRAAKAAGGFLELVAVNFDHPKGAEHLCQVRRFITEEESHLSSLNSSFETRKSTNISVTGSKFMKGVFSVSNPKPHFIHLMHNLFEGRGVYAPCKEDTAVHDGSSNYGHGVAFLLDAILPHTGVTDGHVHALIDH